MSLKHKNRAAFIPFVVVGDPNLEVSEQAVEILIEAGADLIELGVPFSDALADGPVIQAASERASKTTSLTDVFSFAAKIHLKHPQFPFVLFTYYNPIYKMGIPEFVKQAKTAGIYAVLVVDLPPEEAVAYSALMNEGSIKTVFLASPTTTSDRLPLIAKLSTGFIYYVSRAGVTGVQKEVSKTLEKEVAALRNITDQSIAVGFGISDGAQAKQVAKVADAVVVGSAFVKLIAERSVDLSKVRLLAEEIKAACGKD